MVHTQPSDRLEQVENEFAIAETTRHDGECADLHTAGSDGDEVGRDAVEFEHQDPQDLRLLGNVGLDVEQFLDRCDICGLVGERRNIVHAGAKRDALRPRAELHVLFDAGVQVADAGACFGDDFAVDLKDQAQHTMCRRVLRTHIDDNAVAFEAVGADRVPVLAGDRVNRSGRSLVAACVGICGHQL